MICGVFRTGFLGFRLFSNTSTPACRSLAMGRVFSVYSSRQTKAGLPDFLGDKFAVTGRLVTHAWSTCM